TAFATKFIIIALASLLLLATPAWAASGAVDSGSYRVYYSVVNSMDIPTSVAHANGITRAGDRAVMTITLHKTKKEQSLNPVAGRVSGHAQDLMGERMPLEFDRIRMSGSVYSLAQIPVKDGQTITLDLEIRPVNGNATIPVTFTHTFHTR